MSTFDLAAHCDAVAEAMRRLAFAGVHDGHVSLANDIYVARCRVVDDVTRAVLIFTRDTGHHTSGWMKNPDYERCLHLSISRAPDVLVLPGLQRADLDKATIAAWVRAFFREDARFAWLESPKSKQGKRHGVMHWRVFCDPWWQPIKPRGEVYSLDFTEKGWRSASEVLALGGPAVESTVDPS